MLAAFHIRCDNHVPLAERHGAVPAWTDFEAEGVEGELQLRRQSNRHGCEWPLLVLVPVETELHRIEILGNNAKANVGKACCVNVSEAIRRPPADFP